MKHWEINIVTPYVIEADTVEEAMEQAEIQFLEETHPDDYYITVNCSWEE